MPSIGSLVRPQRSTAAFLFQLPVPWQALPLSIAVHVALSLAAGSLSRRGLIASRGEAWFRERFLPVLTPITITALRVRRWQPPWACGSKCR